MTRSAQWHKLIFKNRRVNANPIQHVPRKKKLHFISKSGTPAYKTHHNFGLPTTPCHPSRSVFANAASRHRATALRPFLTCAALPSGAMIAPRKEAFQRWWDTQFPQHSELSMHEIYELYDAAYAKVRAATLRKKARIHKLATMLALVKDALKKQR